MVRTFTVSAVEISKVDPTLDPVTVYYHDFLPGQGRVIIETFGMAWSCYFGAMGNRNIQQFVKEASVEYLVGKLMRHKELKRDIARLTRIIRALAKD